MDKDNKKNDKFNKMLDSFCSEEADIQRATDGLYSLFKALMASGFTEDQAIKLLYLAIFGAGGMNV